MTAETRTITTQALAFAFALLVQTATIVWWASGVNTRLEAVEVTTKETNAQQDARIQRLQDESQRGQISEARLLAQLDAMIASIDELKAGQQELLRRLSMGEKP